MAYTKELDFAVELVRQCCRITTAVANATLTDQTVIKKDKSPVTVGDYSVQALVNHRIAETFPGDKIIAEEDTKQIPQDILEKIITHVNNVAQLTREQILRAIDRGDSVSGEAGRCWVLDPIDGTLGFLRREQYAVCLALMVDGAVVVGVLGCPNFEGGTIVAAQKGCGAVLYHGEELTAQPIAVTATTSSTEMVFCESVEASHSDGSRSQRIGAALGIRREPLRIDSQCKYMAVAAGRADAYLRLPRDRVYQERIWDHAAGWLIVHEAGGRVTDIEGKELDFKAGRTLRNNLGIICSNGKLHDAVLAAVKPVFADLL